MIFGNDLYDTLLVAGESTVFTARGFNNGLISIDYHHNLHSLSTEQVTVLCEVWYRKYNLMEAKKAKENRDYLILTALLLGILAFLAPRHENINLLIWLLVFFSLVVFVKTYYIAYKNSKDVKTIYGVLIKEKKSR